nr:BamA/TamA family outer membrane protein [Spirosoma rhododendri]
MAAHPVYRIGAVDVRISPDETQPAAFVSQPDTVTRNGVLYLLNGRNLSSRLLDNKILLRPGDLYSQIKYRETQRQLFLLNQFKFVNLNFTDTTSRRLQTLITATPLDKYEATAEGGLTVLYQAQSYPGGFGSLSFRARNLLGGLETFELTGRYGLEAQTGFLTAPGASKQVYTSQELGISSSLIFPQILFPGPLRNRFNPYNPRTQVSLSYNNTLRPDFRRSLLRGTMAYSWQTTTNKQFSFLIADVNLINANFDTDLGRLFEQQLDSLANLGSTIKLSFRRSLSSSISFAYTYNNNAPGISQGGLRRPTNFLRTVVESGGTTLNFLPNRLIDTANTNLQFYKFLRFNVDFRHYIPLRNRAMLAFRINTGVAYGYGPDGGPVPYEKLFFVGGSNSVRAWLPRRLGPGAAYPYLANSPNRPAIDPNTEQFIYLFEQPGNVLLEGSAEVRGRLFHLGADINGAFFIDAGNVWTLRNNNSTRPGATFQLDSFFPQIAVGTGVGLRIDFSFFVIRLDGGIKVWDPARRYFDSENRLVDDRFILPKFSLRQLSRGPNPLVINFGIGYPF